MSLLDSTPAVFHPIPAGDEKPLGTLRIIPLCKASQWPPPRHKWPKIPADRLIGAGDIPPDPELIKWALAQAAKTVKRRRITPSRPCGMDRDERQYWAHLNAVNAAEAKRELTAELEAHACAFLTAFCKIRQGGNQ